MSLYKRQKGKFGTEDGEKPQVSGEFIPNSAWEDENVEDNKIEKLSPTDGMQCVVGALPDLDIGVDPMATNSLQKAGEYAESSQKKIGDLPVADSTEITGEPASAEIKVSSACDLGLQEHDVEMKPLPAESVEGSAAAAAALLPEVKDLHVESANTNIEEGKLIDTKCGPLINSDVSSEASETMMPESMVAGSVNLSRIHHSPESTH